MMSYQKISDETLGAIPERWHAELQTFLKTGDASQEFRAFIDDSPQCQRVIDDALSKQFDDIRRILPEQQREAATAPARTVWSVAFGVTAVVAALAFGRYFSPDVAENRQLQEENRALAKKYEAAIRPREPRESLAEMKESLTLLPAWLTHEDERVQKSAEEVLLRLPDELPRAMARLPRSRAQELGDRLGQVASAMSLPTTAQDKEVITLQTMAAKLKAPLGESSERARKNLASADEQIRLQAAKTLGQLGSAADSAVPDIVQRLRVASISPAEKSALEDSLARISPDTAVRLARRTTGRNIDPTKAYIEILCGELRSDDVATRIRTANELGELGRQAHGTAADLRRAFQEEKDPWARWELAAALAQVDPVAAKQAGLPVLDEKLFWAGPVQVQQRKLAGWALGCLELDDPAVRVHGAEALIHLGPAAAGTFPRVLEKYEAENDAAVKKVLGGTLRMIAPGEAQKHGIR